MDIEKLVNHSSQLINENKFQEALSILENIEKKDSKVFFLIGSIHLSLKNIDLAEKNLLLALERNKNNFSIYNNLGIVSKVKGDSDNAKNYFIKAIEIEENIETLCEIGRLSLQHSDFDSAQKYLGIALKKDNNHQKTNLFLGEMYKKMNMIQKGWFHKHKATGLIRFSKNGVELIG